MPPRGAFFGRGAVETAQLRVRREIGVGLWPDPGIFREEAEPAGRFPLCHTYLSGAPRMTHTFVLASIPVELQALLHALLGTAAFGLLGLVMMLVGFKAFELVTRRLDIEKQLEDRNMAVGAVVASLLFGISLIVVFAML